MLVTCDSYCNMGYVYLMLENKEYIARSQEQIDKLRKEIGDKYFDYKLYDETQITQELSKFRVSAKSYKKLLSEGKYTEQYYNDKTKSGYITGIELNLSKENFLSLIKNGSYKCYEIPWRRSTYDFIFLDSFENTFKPTNMVLPLNNKRDVFAILDLENEYDCIKICALISSRRDLYSTKYLKEPLFVIW